MFGLLDKYFGTEVDLSKPSERVSEVPTVVWQLVLEFVEFGETSAVCSAVNREWRAIINHPRQVARQREWFARKCQESSSSNCLGLAALIDSPLTDLCFGISDPDQLESHRITFIRGFFNDRFIFKEHRKLLLRQRMGLGRRCVSELFSLRRYGSIILLDDGCDQVIPEMIKDLTVSKIATPAVFPDCIGRVICEPIAQSEKVSLEMADGLRAKVESEGKVPFALLWLECVRNPDADGRWEMEWYRWKYRCVIPEIEGNPYSRMCIQGEWELPLDYPFKPPVLRMDPKVRHLLRYHNGEWQSSWLMNEINQEWSPRLTLVNLTQSVLRFFCEEYTYEVDYLDSELNQALRESKELYCSLIRSAFDQE